MSAPNVNRWIGIGLLGLPLYGALTFFSSLNPQPDPSTRYEARARFVSTDAYVLKHLFVSVLGIVFVIFGTFALGAYLTRSRAGHGLDRNVTTLAEPQLWRVCGGVIPVRWSVCAPLCRSSWCCDHLAVPFRSSSRGCVR